VEPDTEYCAFSGVLKRLVVVWIDRGEASPDGVADFAIGFGESRAPVRSGGGDYWCVVEGTVNQGGGRPLMEVARDARVLPGLSKAATKEELPKTF
jgi:hypothetical protein